MENASAGRRARLIAWAPALAIAAAAIHLCWTMRGGYWFETHEWIWYPVRLVEYVQAWKGGSLYPRYCPDLYGGYGYPFFNYYAPGLYATAAVLMVALGTTAGTALKLAIGVFTVAGGLGMYGLVRGETRRSDVALVSAIVFINVPYRLTDLFTRGDLAEYAALSMLPFALWAYRALGRAADEKVPRAAFCAAMAHAAVWFCHTITGLYATEVIGLMLLVTALVHRRRPAELRRALLGGAALLLALAMAAIYIAPAWLERSLVNLDSIRSGGFHPTKNLVYWRWAFAFGFFSFGVPSVLALLAAPLTLVLPSARKNAAALARWWLPVILIANLIFTWAEPIWNLLPLGAYIQFPWRLIGFVGVFASVGVGVTLANVLPARWAPLRWSVCVLLAIAVAWVEHDYDRAGAFLPPTKIPSTPDEIQRGLHSTVVANEYLPLAARIPPITPRDQSTVPVTGSPTLNTWRPTPLRYVIDVDARQPGSVVDLQVFDFPGWKVTTEQGPADVQRSVPKSGLIRLYFPATGHYRVVAWFGLTFMRACAGLLSLLAFALGYWALRRLSALRR